MKLARFCLGHYGFKMSINKILQRCKWCKIEQMIIGSGIISLHKILKSQRPRKLYNLFKKNSRTVSEISLKYYPKSTKFRNYHFHCILCIYNKLSPAIKQLTVRQLKYKFKTASGLIPDSYD